MSSPWRIERVAVEPTGPAPWQLEGAAQSGVATAVKQWGFDDWAWGTVELLAFVRSTEYERFELLVALEPGAPAEPDSVVGAALVNLPDADNTGLVGVAMWVRAEHRRAGCGTVLLAEIDALAAREGRSTVLIESDHQPAAPGMELLEAKSRVGVVPRDAATEFVLAHGFELEQVERISTCHLPPDGDALAALHADATAHAGADYVIHSWQGATPDRWLDGLAALIGRMSIDAPFAGLDIEPEVWDADRVRSRDAERGVKDRGSLTVVAEHVPSGQLAAFTEVEWPLAKPAVAYQHDTLVAAPHRGRRLGLLVKSAQLLTLAQLKPELRRLHTWNAAENGHMLAINDAVGFTVTGSSGEWQRAVRR